MPKAQKNKEKPNTAQITEAIDYKLQAYSYEQIAEEMKITLNEVVDLVHAGVAKLIRDEPELRMLLDLKRIDQMLTAVYPAAAQGDHQAITTVLALRRDRELIEKKFERAESFRMLAPGD